MQRTSDIIRGNKFYYRDEKNAEHYICVWCALEGNPAEIPPDHFFALGDNSPNSRDSRMWGYVPRRNLVGEAFFIFRPVTRWRIIR